MHHGAGFAVPNLGDIGGVWRTAQGIAGLLFAHLSLFKDTADGGADIRVGKKACEFGDCRGGDRVMVRGRGKVRPTGVFGGGCARFSPRGRARDFIVTRAGADAEALRGA